MRFYFVVLLFRGVGEEGRGLEVERKGNCVDDNGHRDFPRFLFSFVLPVPGSFETRIAVFLVLTLSLGRLHIVIVPVEDFPEERSHPLNLSLSS